MQENRNIIESYRDTFKKQLKDTAKVGNKQFAMIHFMFIVCTKCFIAVRNIQDEEELESLLDDGKPIQMFIDNVIILNIF